SNPPPPCDPPHTPILRHALPSRRQQGASIAACRGLMHATTLLCFTLEHRRCIMPNPGQPTIAPGATGEGVRPLQRPLRRTPNLGLVVDGVFGPKTEAAVKDFQQGAGLTPDGTVGPQTWAALPGGGAMPTLQEGASGAVVKSLQQVLTIGAPGEWNTKPGPIDGQFGPQTRASVKAFQPWGGVPRDGVVGDLTGAESLHAASATLESRVGLQFVTS